MKLAAIAKLIKADEYCKLYKVFYNDGQGCDLYIGTKNSNLPADRLPESTKRKGIGGSAGYQRKGMERYSF